MEHKSDNNLQRVNIEEKLPWKAYRNSPTLFRTVPSPNRYDLFFPNLRVRNLTQNSNRCYLRNGWSYGLQIWPVHSQDPFEQKPIKIWEKRERRRIQGLPNFLDTPIISSWTGKATNFKFCRHIHRIDRNKSPLKILGKVAICALRDSGNFWGYPYIGRIARSSLW